MDTLCKVDNQWDPLHSSGNFTPCSVMSYMGRTSIKEGICILFLLSASDVSDSAMPWTAACQASLSFTVSQSLLKLMSIEPGIPSNHLILCRPLLLLPSTFPSIRVSSNESAFHIRWAKYMSFFFSINPSNEYSALIPFRIDWFDLLDQICTYTWFTLLYSRNNIIKQLYSNKVDLKKNK